MINWVEFWVAYLLPSLSQECTEYDFGGRGVLKQNKATLATVMALWHIVENLWWVQQHEFLLSWPLFIPPKQRLPCSCSQMVLNSFPVMLCVLRIFHNVRLSPTFYPYSIAKNTWEQLLALFQELIINYIQSASFLITSQLLKYCFPELPSHKYST